MNYKIYIIIFILIFSNICNAENEEVIRLKSILNTSKIDSNKALLYRDLAFEYASINPTVATLYADSCLLTSKLTNFLKGEAAAYNTYGVINFSQSNYSKALEYYFKALKINEKINFLKGISSNYGNIGNAYYQQFDYEKSLPYHKKALSINQEIKNQIGLSNNLSNIGLIYYSKQEFKDALEYYKKSLEINKKINNETGIAYNLNNIGLVYSGMKEYIKSIECYNKSLAISTKLNNNVNIANSLESIGNIYLQLKVYDKSYDYLIKSIKISREIGAKNILKTALYDLHIVNENRGKYNESLNNLKEFYLIRDSIYNFESNLKMAQLDFKYKEDKKDKEIEFFKMSDDKQKADLKAKSLTIYFSIGGFVLVSLLAFFIFTRFQIKKKSNIELESKNAQIEDQNIELLALNEDMLEQKRIVELAHYQLSEKNEEVLSSIRYAQKIQIAILPFESTIKKHINEFFIIFKPKDIISGDFYWYNETNDQIYLAVADCTGHGVPGSMLSMIGAMIMNEAIQKEIYTLNGILNYLNNTFNNALSNSNSELETSDLRDGMDVCLISIDKITKKVSFSGANRPLYYITDGQIKEIKGTRKSIGGKIRNQNEFEVFDIEFSNNSYFYLSSDGYADQGNEYSKKLSTKILKEEILKIHQQDLNNQKEHLINLFEEHKSNAEQRDDVTLIGIKLKD